MPPSHLVASAIVVDAAGTRVLLWRHGDLRRWGPPGGHVDGDETLSTALVRAVAEHTGLTRVRVLEPHLAVVQDVADCGTGSEVRHVDHLFVVVADPDDELSVEPGAELGWFPLTDLPQPLVPGIGMHLRAGARAVAE